MAPKTPLPKLTKKLKEVALPVRGAPVAWARPRPHKRPVDPAAVELGRAVEDRTGLDLWNAAGTRLRTGAKPSDPDVEAVAFEALRSWYGAHPELPILVDSWVAQGLGFAVLCVQATGRWTLERTDDHGEVLLSLQEALDDPGMSASGYSEEKRRTPLLRRVRAYLATADESAHASAEALAEARWPDARWTEQLMLALCFPNRRDWAAVVRVQPGLAGFFDFSWHLGTGHPRSASEAVAATGPLVMSDAELDALAEACVERGSGPERTLWSMLERVPSARAIDVLVRHSDRPGARKALGKLLKAGPEAWQPALDARLGNGAGSPELHTLRAAWVSELGLPPVAAPTFAFSDAEARSTACWRWYGRGLPDRSRLSKQYGWNVKQGREYIPYPYVTYKIVGTGTEVRVYHHRRGDKRIQSLVFVRPRGQDVGRGGQLRLGTIPESVMQQVVTPFAQMMARTPVSSDTQQDPIDMLYRGLRNSAKRAYTSSGGPSGSMRGIGAELQHRLGEDRFVAVRLGHARDARDIALVRTDGTTFAVYPEGPPERAHPGRHIPEGLGEFLATMLGIAVEAR